MDDLVKRREERNFFNRLLNMGSMAAMAMILFFMVAISTRVGMRYVFQNPFNWVIDVSTILQLYLTFLAAAWLLREEGHISIDVVFSLLKPRTQFLVQVINSLVCAMVCSCIGVFGVVETWSSWKLDLYADMPLEPPKWVLLVIIPLGAFTLLVQFLIRARTFLRKYRRSVSSGNAHSRPKTR